MSVYHLERFVLLRWLHAYARENYARYSIEYYDLLHGSFKVAGRPVARIAEIANPARIETELEVLTPKDARIMGALHVEGEIQLLKTNRPDPKVIEFYKAILRGFWVEDEHTTEAQLRAAGLLPEEKK